ncbi:MAG: hypothetical protein ACI92E_001693 [Oceanicoccus sp.]|jgi:uncharacterized protein (DUF1499 family)
MIKLLKPLAILAVLGFPIAVIGFRLNLWPFPTSFQILTYTVYLSVAVFFLSVVMSFVKRNDSALGKSARTATIIVLLPLVGLGSQLFTARSVPGIHNISTDIVNPPKFDKVVALRNDYTNPLEYNIEELAEIQSKAYPNVITLMTDLSIGEAHVQAKAVVESMGLELVNSDAETGIIEATETSAIWGFKDDIVVRISEKEGKTAVDLRSVSRIGRSDLGANANRIEKFLAKF